MNLALSILAVIVITLLIVLKQVTFYISLQLKKGVNVRHINILPFACIFWTPSYFYLNMGWLIFGIQINLSFLKQGITIIRKLF